MLVELGNEGEVWMLVTAEDVHAPYNSSFFIEGNLCPCTGGALLNKMDDW